MSQRVHGRRSASVRRRERWGWRAGAAVGGIFALLSTTLIATGASADDDATAAGGASAGAEWTVTAAVDPAGATSASPGDPLTHTLSLSTTTDASTVPIVVDDLSGLLDDATVSSTTEELAAAGLVFDATAKTITWTATAPVPAGAALTTSFAVTVDDDAEDGATLATAATVEGAAACEPDDACATALTVTAASSDPATDPTEEPTAEPTDEPDAAAGDAGDGDGAARDSDAPQAKALTDATADAAPLDAAVVPLVVPGPTASTSVITVKVGSDRTGVSGVTNLAGATLALFDSATATTQSAGTGNPTTCVSDADGDCSFVIADTQTGGANLNRRFWVRQISPPVPGYYANLTLGAENAQGGTTSQTYQFQTGTQLQAGQTYASSSSFMVGTGTAANVSGGVWQNSRINPTLSAQCGLSVAIVADLSGSVGSELPNLKGAANTLVDALTGTPSTVSLFTFATTSPAAGGTNVNRPGLTAVSTTAGASTVKGWINGWVIPTGTQQYTNWDRAFAAVADATQHYDVVVVITDGNPTVYGTNTSPVQTRFREVENGIFSANAVKAEGSRLIAMGVGAGIGSASAGLNLRSISGTTLNSDYFQTADYSAAGAALRALALGNCLGTITVVKQVQPPGTAAGSTAGGVPTGGWTFTATGSTGVSVSPGSGQTDTATGALNFGLTLAGGVTSGTVTLGETQQAGYTLNQIGGNNAVCTRVDTGAAVAVTNTGATSFSVPVAADVPISCTVYNVAQQPPAAAIAAKRWIIDGVVFDNGTQPPALQALLAMGGTAQDWGTQRTGLTAGDTLAVSESTSIESWSLCTITSSRVTSVNGGTVDLPLPYTATLVAGLNSYEITNTATCPSRLTLTKQVVNGPATADAWTLNATAPGGALPFASGTSGVTHPVTPLTTYPLSETGGDPRYVQQVGIGANAIPGSTVSWFCSQVDPVTGVVIAGFSDGLNGGVTAPRGYAVNCVARNQSAPLTLIKHVVNDDGGSLDASAWNLTATPTTPPAVPAGLGPQTVAGSETGTVVWVRPGQPYNLSESTVTGYSNTDLECYTTTDATPRVVSQVVLAVGEAGFCTFTNDDDAPHLTLVKRVLDQAGGDITTPELAARWTLTASGTDGFSGAGNTADVTDQVVRANTSYTLSESTVPGYVNGTTWSCTGGTFTGPDTISLQPGADATCTMTNTVATATLTFQKSWVNGAAGDSAALGITGAATGSATATVPPGGSGVSADDVAVTVSTGQTVNLGEVLSDANTGSYTSAISCSPAGGFTPNADGRGGTYVVPEQPVDVTCTVTNSRTAVALTLTKDWVDGVSLNDAVIEIDGQGLTGSGSAVATVPPGGTGTSSETVTVIAYSGDTATLSEQIGGPNPDYTTTLTCDDGTLTYTAGETDGSLALPKTLDQDITCTFRNTPVEPEWTLEKSSDPASGSTVQPGDVITYTLTATHVAGTATPVGVQATDDLSAVLLHATLVEPLPAGLTLEGTTLTWTIGDLDSTASVTYSVTVAADAFGVELVNVATPGTGGECTLPADCTTTHPTPHFVLEKSSNPASGATVLPGDIVTYTLTATNDSDGVLSGAVVTDDLSDVLDDATIGTIGSGGSLTGTTLTWAVPTLQPGGAATLSYTVTVNADAIGVTLVNVATPGTGGECTLPADCTTTHPTPHFVLEKTSDPASGTIVLPGDTVTYTLTATNDSDGVLSGAVVIDDLSDVLDDATIGTIGSGGSLSGTTLTWAVPTLQPGDVATLSYTVTVNADAIGVTLVNVATPGTGGECTLPADCTTTHPTPSWVLAKTADPVTGSAVDVGSAITYTLTATNRSSAPVSGATAVDTLPTGVTLVEPLDPGLTPGPDGTLTWAIPDIAVGGAVTVTYQVTVDASAAGTTLTNVVVPGTPDGICIADEDCTTTHDVTQLIVDVADDCRLDAAYLTYSISSKNVPDAENLPVTVTWRTATGTVVRVDTIPAGQLTGELLWPGMVLNGDDVAIGWPGWRALAPSDFPLAPGAEIYGTQIRDTSLASEAYRNAMTVTFEMNPQAVATVDYPAVTPAGCAVPRDPDLHVVKTADRSTIKPGETFSYAIDVRNDSTLGVAYPVTLSDPIPSQLKVTAIDTAESGFPHWQDCAIVGSDADGYGGTLTCDLSAALGVSSSAPPITLSVLVAAGASGEITNTATACWMNPSDASAGERCAEGSASVTAGAIPVTGVESARLGWLAVVMLLGGALLLTAGTIRRRRLRRAE